MSPCLPFPCSSAKWRGADPSDRRLLALGGLPGARPGIAGSHLLGKRRDLLSAWSSAGADASQCEGRGGDRHKLDCAFHCGLLPHDCAGSPFQGNVEAQSVFRRPALADLLGLRSIPCASGAECSARIGQLGVP